MHIKVSERIFSVTGTVIGLFVGSSIMSIIKIVHHESTFMQEIPQIVAGAATAGAVIFLLCWVAKKLWG